jgi:hypothetical protein
MCKCCKLQSHLGRNSLVEKLDVKPSDPNDSNGSEEILMLPYLSKKASLLVKLIRVRTDRLHTSLFYLTCNFNDKIHDMIINGYNCENVVLTK